MTFKEFNNWCNVRTTDGMWGEKEAKCCIAVIDYVHKIRPWFNKEKKYETRWNSILDDRATVEKIVEETNNLIEKYKKS